MAQYVKCLLCKHEDLNLGPQCTSAYVHTQTHTIVAFEVKETVVRHTLNCVLEQILSLLHTVLNTTQFERTLKFSKAPAIQ